MSIEAVVSVVYGPDVQGARNVSQYVVHRVLLVLAEHADPWGRGARPSQRAIADSIGIDQERDRRTVSNALKALVAQGRITKTGEAVARRLAATYQVHLIGDCVGCEDDDSVGWDPPSSNGEHPIEHRVNSVGDSVGDSVGWSPHQPEPDPQRRAVASSDHITVFATNGCEPEDQDPRPPDWIGGPR